MYFIHSSRFIETLNLLFLVVVFFTVFFWQTFKRICFALKLETSIEQKSLLGKGLRSSMNNSNK